MIAARVVRQRSGGGRKTLITVGVLYAACPIATDWRCSVHGQLLEWLEFAG